MRIIALANQKGGTGKTTTAVNLGAALAERKRHVLLMDLDPQSHLTAHLGLEATGQGLYDVFLGGASMTDVIRREVSPRLDVVPGGLELAAAEVEVAGEVGREVLLRKAIATVADEYDYILMDCSPSLGLLTVNALTAAREVFIPVQAEWLALRALGQLLETVQVVQERLNPELEITGVIVCMYKARRVLCGQVVEALKEHFGRRVFKTVIRENIRLAEAPSHGVPIITYDPRSRGAEDYRALAREVLAQERRRAAAAQGKDKK
ncbi:MAG: ParA family protein [Armatimonadetes bacterium]|nr:ParA family protein [Armatimonadota bacterium]